MIWNQFFTFLLRESIHGRGRCAYHSFPTETLALVSIFPAEDEEISYWFPHTSLFIL